MWRKNIDKFKIYGAINSNQNGKLLGVFSYDQTPHWRNVKQSWQAV